MGPLGPEYATTETRFMTEPQDTTRAIGQSPDPVTCPFCSSTETDLVSEFGSQALLSQHRCQACRSYFEAVRNEKWE